MSNVHGFIFDYIYVFQEIPYSVISFGVFPSTHELSTDNRFVDVLLFGASQREPKAQESTLLECFGLALTARPIVARPRQA